MRVARVMGFVWLVLVGPARGGSYALTFADLAGEAGQVVASVTEQGFTLSSPAGFEVVGPESPSYAGSIGLVPQASGDWTLSDGAGQPIYDDQQSAVDVDLFRIGSFASYSLGWMGSLGGVAQWTWSASGTIYPGGTFAQLEPGLAPVDTIAFTNELPGVPYQFAEVTVFTEALAVPEPSALQLLGVAALLAIAMGIPEASGEHRLP